MYRTLKNTKDSDLWFGYFKDEIVDKDCEFIRLDKNKYILSSEHFKVHCDKDKQEIEIIGND